MDKSKNCAASEGTSSTSCSVVYCCDQCGKKETWRIGWRHWGSHALLDDGKMIVTCSEDCRSKISIENTWVKKYGESVSQSEQKAMSLH